MKQVMYNIELTIPQSFYISNINYFDDYFVFQNNITKKYYKYLILENEYEEITKNNFNFICETKYEIIKNTNDQILVYDYNKMSEVIITFDDIMNCSLIKEKLNDYKIKLRNSFLMQNMLIINVELTVNHNLLLQYDFENNSFNYYDWVYNKNPFAEKSKTNILYAFIIERPNEDTVFTRYIKSYNN